jgi:glycosyltransferase involved in cell wall biosynthesis
MLVTVLIPTHDHGPLLRTALRSALTQTVSELELFVVGDGVPDLTRQLVAEVMREDERVRFFNRPKGARRGEAHRHEALQEARGEIVCYLSDDDLWHPEHVATMRNLLLDADFAAAASLHVTAEGELLTWPFDLRLPAFRGRMATGAQNFVPLSCAAHTLAAYRRLPEGWAPAPASVPSDFFMWQKVLSRPELRARSATRPTVLHFPSTHRVAWTTEARVEELERWAEYFG